MSEPLIVSIPHQLGREEAIRRLKGGLTRAASSVQVLKVDEERWEDNRMVFRVRALGQAASGYVDVEDDHVRLEVTLPWLLQRFAQAAKAAISQRETPGHMLLDSVDISKQPIPVSEGRIDRSVWAVATWTDVDPRIDFFSIFVGGLTNAYQWTDSPAAYHPGDPPGRGRQILHKTLQINFWRPGDEIAPNEREFRYGVPLDKAALYDVPDGVARRWLYR